MKKYFLKYGFALLILIAIVYSSTFTGFGSAGVARQQDSLQRLDTTITFDLGGGVKDLWVTVQDSSNSKTDSIRCYIKTGEQTTIGVMYSNVAFHELSQTTSTTDIALLIPGDGTTSTYKISSDLPFYSLYVVRMNNGGTAGYAYKTPIALTYNN